MTSSTTTTYSLLHLRLIPVDPLTSLGCLLIEPDLRHGSSDANVQERLALFNHTLALVQEAHVLIQIEVAAGHGLVVFGDITLQVFVPVAESLPLLIRYQKLPRVALPCRIIVLAPTIRHWNTFHRRGASFLILATMSSSQP
jgi:hypothetical protein